MNTVDPLGYYHTSYKLAAEGEDIALVAPNLTILSQFGPGGADYPPQVTDISYGTSGPILVSGDSRASYLIPTDGNLGTTWTSVSFNASSNGFSQGRAAMGYDTTTSPIDYADYFQTEVPAGTTSLYIRAEFNVPDAAAVTGLNLNLKYDDGVVVYLNGQKVFSNYAPGSPAWNSLATGGRTDSIVIAGNDISLTPFLELLQSGKNVLAIHALNQSGSSDLLIDPVLTAQGGLGVIGYLSTPTPGGPNSALIDIGPKIDPVEFSPGNPGGNQPITVTARVAPFAAPVNASSVRLVYRVMYGSEVRFVMVDNGTGADAVAGDSIYTAQIPAAAFSAGQMVRWYVTAADTAGATSRAPRFLDPLNSPEYYGTVIVDPTITTDLPVFHWFVEDPSAAATETGTRASLDMNGEFYDNIQVDLHGQSTAGEAFTKKSFNFDANSGLKFDMGFGLGVASDFNLLTNFTDKTYLRNTLAYEVYREAGGLGLYAFSAVVQLNGSYYGLYDVVEDGDEEYLERVGLDPDGALYKMGNGFDSATVNVEKKSREYEDNSDLQQLVDSASLDTSQGEIWVYDNLDIASWVNYFAVQTLIANRDYGQKNYFLYNDSNGTELWTLLPWDMDLSYGHQWNPTERYFDDDLIYNDGFYVYQGGNHLIERLRALPLFNQMYTRRLRTLIDEFYGPVGGNIEDSYIADRFDELLAEIGDEALLDRNTWGVPAGLAYETPTQAIARVKQYFLALRKQYLNGLSTIPATQVAVPSVTISEVEFDPAGGNQDQEYIALHNHSRTGVDVSGWTLSGAVDVTLAGGTVIPGNSTYYVVADVAAFKQRTTGPRGGQSLFIQGNYDGRLDNQYGELALRTNVGTLVASTSYGTPPIPGDYDASGTVDDADYDLWKGTFGSTADLRADGNGNHVVDAGDYTVWRDNFGATNQPLGGGSAASAPSAAAVADGAGLQVPLAEPAANQPAAAPTGDWLMTLETPFVPKKNVERHASDSPSGPARRTQDAALLAALADSHAPAPRERADLVLPKKQDENAQDTALLQLMSLPLAAV